MMEAATDVKLVLGALAVAVTIGALLLLWGFALIPQFRRRS